MVGTVRVIRVVLVGVLLLGLGRSTVSAKTFIIPHVIETSGTITNTQNTFDTTIFATYVCGLPGASPRGCFGATVDIYLFDSITNRPLMRTIGGIPAEVCGPCTFALDSMHRKITFSVEQQFGGSLGKRLVRAHAIVVVSGDEDHVNLLTAVGNSGSARDTRSMVFNAPQPVRAKGGRETRRAFVLPHVLESSGRATAPGVDSFDTQLIAVDSCGLPEVHAGRCRGARLDLYLYDESTSQALKGPNGGNVCNPCTFTLTQRQRTVSISVAQLIAQAGAADGVVKLGFGIIVVGGSDPDAVSIQGFVVNAHSSPFDLSVFGFDPQPIAAAP